MKVAVTASRSLLRSEVQGKILAELFVDPGAEHTVPALRLGNARLVRVDLDNPLYSAVREVVLATCGAPAVLNHELAGMPGIELLFIFGSFAARYLGESGPPPNDADVLLIGEPERGAVCEAAERAERRLALPVQLTVRSRREGGRAGCLSAPGQVQSAALPARSGRAHMTCR
jgi:hypothetical protein